MIEREDATRIVCIRRGVNRFEEYVQDIKAELEKILKKELWELQNERDRNRKNHKEALRINKKLREQLKRLQARNIPKDGPPTIEQTAWVIEKLHDHMKEGGPFLYLIYKRLGFPPSAYTALYKAGGLAISDKFNEDKDNGPS